jgi:large subunit ribosomal protein L13
MKTYSPKPDHIERRWYVIDAGGHVLGRVATEAATLLRGKHKPMFAPHMDTGDHVIVINADKVELTGNKARDKIAYRHSGYPGGISGTAYGELLAVRPVAAVEKAVRGMLPKNRLGRQMIKKLHVVAGPEHPHAAQRPTPLALGERPVWEGLPSPAPRTRPTKAEAAETAPAKTSARKPAARKPAAAKASAKKETAAKEPTAATSPAKKTAAKSPAKKTAAKAPAAKPTAKKPTAKKPTAKKSPAKKAADETSEE